MTKSQINKLGEKLRAAGPPDAEALRCLQEFRARYSAPMGKAQALLNAQLGVEATARLKTINTIVEKLRRERTRLAEMQDIAGLRIVDEMRLSQQDAVVDRIRHLFPGAKVMDRRKRPSHGYRAVHVIPTVDGYPVEIQVRTMMQDLWAQAMERLADEVGREIRYGGIPEHRADEVAKLKEISHAVAETERLVESVREMEAQRELHLAHLRLNQERAELKRLSKDTRDILRAFLAGKGDSR